MQVFDVGMHIGEDTAYYLHLGHHVIGIEANPALAAKCRERFARELRERNLEILNIGIGAEAGVFMFYESLVRDGWSTFDQQLAADRGAVREYQVPCRTLAQVIAECGKPYFIKLDIEGAEMAALSTLRPGNAPPYLSAEIGTDDEVLERLVELGYQHFKFVDGATYRSAPPIFPHEIGWRALRKVARKVPALRRPLQRLGLQKSEFQPDEKYSPAGYPFGRASGPFGETAHGHWMGARRAFAWLSKLREGYRRSGGNMWWDVHARR